MKNGIHLNLDETEYHADAGSVSKTGLWALHSKTPAHFRFSAPRTREPKLDFGNATHTAVLQPDLFEARVKRGPIDRRGNKWKDALAEAEADGAVLLPEAEYDKVLAIQTAAHQHPLIMKLASTDTVYEGSAFWQDKRTGIQCRCRPDIYAPGLKIMADLKTTTDASEWNWSRTAGNLGYHVQEAMYSEGWQRAGGGEVDGFVFLVIEDKAPFCTVVYELEPSASTEGHAVFQRALDQYKACLEADEWPGYATDVQPLDIPHFSYRETDSPNITP